MSLISGFLNQAASLLLDLDPDGKARFQRLEGKVICIELSKPPVSLLISPDRDGLKISTAKPGEENSRAEADVTLSGTLAAFLEVAREGTHSGVFSSGRITMQGDVEVGQVFQKAVMGFDLDWEELVSRFAGDTPARKAGVMARGFAQWGEETIAYSRENFADYLKEEVRILPSEVAVERFRRQVAELRADVDRFEKRLQRLRKRRESSGGQF